MRTYIHTYVVYISYTYVHVYMCPYMHMLINMPIHHIYIQITEEESDDFDPLTQKHKDDVKKLFDLYKVRLVSNKHDLKVTCSL
jgi:hypothetical protein